MWRWLLWKPDDSRWQVAPPVAMAALTSALVALGTQIGLPWALLLTIPWVCGLFAVIRLRPWMERKKDRATQYTEVLQRASGALYAGLRVVLPLAPANGDSGAAWSDEDTELMAEAAQLSPTASRQTGFLEQVLANTIESNVSKPDKTGALRIMAASGNALIGRSTGGQRGILYDEIMGWPNAVDVLLLCPDGRWSERRGDDLGIGATKYRSDILRQVIELDRIATERGQRPTTVRFYDDRPIWQMVMTEYRTLLMSAVHPVRDRQLHQQSPLYVLERRNRAERFGLHHGIEAVWQRRSAHVKPRVLSELRLGGLDLNLSQDERSELTSIAGSSELFGAS